jgi:hypothetical protein
VRWFVSSKVRRAKRLLAGTVNDDLSAVNAIGIAVHNVVKSFRHMRLLYANVEVRSGLSAEAAAEQSLFAPVSVYRQAVAEGRLGDCPYLVRALDRRGGRAGRGSLSCLYGGQLEPTPRQPLGSCNVAGCLEPCLRPHSAPW